MPSSRGRSEKSRCESTRRELHRASSSRHPSGDPDFSRRHLDAPEIEVEITRGPTPEIPRVNNVGCFSRDDPVQSVAPRLSAHIRDVEAVQGPTHALRNLRGLLLPGAYCFDHHRKPALCAEVQEHICELAREVWAESTELFFGVPCQPIDLGRLMLWIWRSSLHVTSLLLPALNSSESLATERPAPV